MQALSKFVSLNDDATMPKSVWTSGADPNALFKSGQVVAYFSGVWQVADFADSITSFDWASARRRGPVHATDINLGGKVVAFNNGDKAEPAKKWVDYIFQPANYTKLAQVNGYLPVESGLTLNYPFKKRRPWTPSSSTSRRSSWRTRSPPGTAERDEAPARRQVHPDRPDQGRDGQADQRSSRTSSRRSTRS